MKTPQYAIEAQALTRKFGDKIAVDSVNLKIKQGEIYGFLGPNGAGKSTTIRMLVTLLSPTSGDAKIMGQSIVKNPNEVRLNIGVALQEAALDEQQTGSEFLRLQARLYGMRGSMIDQRLAELRKLIDIGEALDKRIKTYSGGMKRRLDLAAALVHNPKVLFLDEPTTGLDPLSRAKVWEEVRRLNSELGMTIFLTTQYLEEADQLADRVGIISNGKIAAEGTPSQLKRKIGSDVILLKPTGDIDVVARSLKKLSGVDSVQISGKQLTIATKNSATVVGDVAIAMKKLHIAIEEMTLRTTTLDDVFLEVTGSRLKDDNQEEES